MPSPKTANSKIIQLNGFLNNTSLSANLEIPSTDAGLKPVLYAVKSQTNHTLGFINDADFSYEQLVDLWFYCTDPDFSLDKIKPNSIVTFTLKYQISEHKEKKDVEYTLARYPYVLENLYYQVGKNKDNQDLYLYKLTVGNSQALSQLHLTHIFNGTPSTVIKELLAACGFKDTEFKLNITDGEARLEYCEGLALDCLLQILRRNAYVAYFDEAGVLHIIDKETAYQAAAYSAHAMTPIEMLQHARNNKNFEHAMYVSRIANLRCADQQLNRANINNGTKISSRAHEQTQLYTGAAGKTDNQSVHSQYHLPGTQKHLDRLAAALRSSETGVSKLYTGTAISFPLSVAHKLETAFVANNDKINMTAKIAISTVSLNIGFFLPAEIRNKNMAPINAPHPYSVFELLEAEGVKAGIHFEFTAIPDNEMPYLKYSPASENSPVFLEAVILDGMNTPNPETTAALAKNRKLVVGLLAERLTPGSKTKYTKLEADFIEPSSLENAAPKPGTPVYVLYYPKTGALLIVGVKHPDDFADVTELRTYFNKEKPTQTSITVGPQNTMLTVGENNIDLNEKAVNVLVTIGKEKSKFDLSQDWSVALPNAGNIKFAASSSEFELTKDSTVKAKSVELSASTVKVKGATTINAMKVGA